MPKVEQLLAELSGLGIAVHAVTLWCEATEGNKQRYGCPHGMGGPVHSGVWYSELCEPDPFDVERQGLNVSESDLEPLALASDCNSLVLGYCTTGILARPEYSPCLAPGFWLAVPEAWQSVALGSGA
jgi:hypothetical protein